MIKLSYQMYLTHNGDKYQLLLNVERDYGREPMAGELVYVGEGDPPLAVRVQDISWFPDFCSLGVEPVYEPVASAPAPTSTLAEIQQFVEAGFRCPWTGYPKGITVPDE